MLTGWGDANQVRFDAVRRYLTTYFRYADIPIPQNVEGIPMFCVEDEDYVIRQLELGRSVYEDRSVAELVKLLEAHTVAETMRDNPERRLVIAPESGGRLQCFLEDLRA